MNTFLIFTIAFVLSFSAQAAPDEKNLPLDAEDLKVLKQNVCHDVVSFARTEGLKKYRMKHCLKNLVISYVDEVYNVNPSAPKKYQFIFQDDYAAELFETEQWIMCEIYLTEPLNPNIYEFSYCSIEG